MTRKAKAPAAPSPRLLAEDALRGGRYAEAVRLALDLPGANDLLAQAVIHRCREWRRNGQPAFAADLIRKVLPRFGADDALRERLAVELVQCGQFAEAAELVADAALLVAAAADAAVARGAAGGPTLPADLQPGHAAVLAAFASFEAGADDAARQHLNALGLSSPFLEWKLLLRGLMAWHAGDDARALENWSRLNDERLPAQLIAPLRARLDITVLQAQPPDVQKVWRLRADRLAGGRLLGELRKLVALVADADDLTPALRQAEVVVPLVRAVEPDGEAVVMATLAAAITHHGRLADIERWRKFLPRPADDPNLDRLQALLAEAINRPDDAATAWLAYERFLAGSPPAFGPDTDRARALVLAHVGDLVQEPVDDDSGLRTIFGGPKPRAAPKARAGEPEKYYDAALRLAPDLLDAHMGRVELARDADQDEQVLQRGRALLALHPHHGATLELMCKASRRLGRPIERLEWAEALRAVDPLNDAFRVGAAAARRAAARARAEAGELEAARADLDAAAAESPAAVNVQRAAVAWLAGDAAGAEASVAAAGLPPAAVAGRLTAEAIALKLPRSIRSRYEPQFKAVLDVGGDPAALLALAEMAADHAAEGLTYRGQKSYEKKIEARLRANVGWFRQAVDLERGCRAARGAGWFKLLFRFANLGAQLFARNPRFPFELAVAEMKLRNYSAGWAKSRLEDARRLLDQLPPGARPAGLEREIRDALDELAELTDGPTTPFLDELFNLFDDGPEGRR